MTDDIDIANERMEIDRTIAIKKRKDQPSIAETGCCLNCDEPVQQGRRWCNAECRDEWEEA